MTIRLFSGYSTDTLGQMYISVASTSSTGTYTDYAMPTGRFFTGFSASIDYLNFSDFLVGAASALQTGLGTPVSIRYDWASGKCILSASQTYNWILDEGTQKILGFNQQYLNTQFITGAIQPFFIWTATNPQRTDDTDVYEDNAIFTERTTDSGRSYSVGRTRTINYRDWGFQMEPKANIYNRYAAVNSAPFTWEGFLTEIYKGPYPFVVFDDQQSSSYTMSYATRDGTYELTKDSYQFKPKKIYGDDDDYIDYLNISLKTRCLSRPNQVRADVYDVLPTSSSFTLPVTSGSWLYFKASNGGNFTTSSYGMRLNYISDSSGQNNNPYTNTLSTIGITSGTFGKASYLLTSSQGQYINAFSQSNCTSSLSSSGLTIFYPVSLIDRSNNGLLPYSGLYLSSSNNVFAMLNAPSFINDIIFTYSSSDGGGQTLYTSSLPLGSKSLATFTFDNLTKSSSFCLNGVSIPASYSYASASNVEFRSSGSYVFGCMPFVFTQQANTIIPEVVVYNRPLSFTEINAVYNYYSSSFGISSSMLTASLLPAYVNNNNPFTPASLNPLIWLDGADAGNITLSSGHVASWANKGSSGGSFANGVAAQQPTYSTTDPDFTYSVTSDGNDFLKSTTFPALSRCSIVFPFKQVTRGNNFYIIAHMGALNSNGSIYIGFAAPDNRLTVRWLNGGNITQKFTTTQFGNGTAKALIQIDLDLSTTGTGQIPNIYVNNVAETLNNSTLTATAGTSTANNTAIFADSVGTYASICKMPEFIVTSDILSTTDRANLYSYLKAKWGTP